MSVYRVLQVSLGSKFFACFKKPNALETFKEKNFEGNKLIAEDFVIHSISSSDDPQALQDPNHCASHLCFHEDIAWKEALTMVI